MSDITSVTEGRVTVTANDTEENIRAAAGFANICITITALLILLNQSKIDNQIAQTNTAAIKKIDSEYLTARETRFKLVEPVA